MGTRKEVTIGITINLDNFENIRFDLKGEAESEEDVSELVRFLDGVLDTIGRDDQATRERVDHYRNRVFGSYFQKELLEGDFGMPESAFTSCPVTGDGERMEDPAYHDSSGNDTPDPLELSGDLLLASDNAERPGEERAAEGGDMHAGVLEEPAEVGQGSGPDTAESPEKSMETGDGGFGSPDEPAPAPEPSSGNADLLAGDTSAGAAPSKTRDPAGSAFVCEACGVEVNKVQHDVSHLFMNKTLCKECMNKS